MSRLRLVLALTASPLFAGCAASVAVPAAAGWLEAPAALTLGPTALDQSVVGALALTNPGSSAVDVTGALSGSDAFALLEPGPWTVPATGAITVELRFTPPSGETQSGELVLSPDPDQVFASDADPWAVSLTGTPDPDADDDGALHPLAGGDDCDDRDPDVHPGATEVFYDGVDQDCDGVDDDQDGDGAARLQDCDDTDASVYPGADELVADGRDSDCDGLVDEDAVAALAGAVIINELLADSLWTDADYGLYVELINTSDAEISLDGWRLGDGEDAGRIGGALSVGPGEIVLLCAETDEDLNRGLPCDSAVAPWPDPTAGSLELWAPVYSDRGVESERVSIDAVAWDSAWPVASGASTQLDPAHASAAENDLPESWCLTASGPEEADWGTPGAANTCP